MIPPRNGDSHPTRSLSLRQTLLLGAGLGILLPALVLAYVQLVTKYTEDVNLRVRAPLQQYADVLARGMAVAIWNVDRAVANELIESVMRNPDVVRVTVQDDSKQVFVSKQTDLADDVHLLQEEREVMYNGARVGQLAVYMSVERVRRDFFAGQIQLAVAILAQVLFSFILIWVLLEKRMFQPLLRLRGAADRLARGALAEPIQFRRHDEIGLLAGSMETMRTDLAGLIAERDGKNLDLQRELAERQRAEQALRASEAKFSGIFAASSAAIAVFTLRNDYEIVDVNATWEAQFGIARSQAIGRNSLALGLWQDTHERAKMFLMLERESAVYRFFAKLWGPVAQGRRSTVVCEVSGQLIRVGAEPLLVLAYDDITDKFEHEREMLRLNATLEQRVEERTRELSETLAQLTAAQDELVRSEKLSALGALVAGVAHELNTPIGNSLTVASTLQDHVREFTRDMGTGLTRSRLEAFVANTGQGASILMNGLRQAADLVASFKQVAVDQTSLNRRRFDLRDAVNEVLTTLGPGLRKTGHTVTNDIPAEIFMESYPGPLGQIITNLVNNAVLHAFEGRTAGRVTIDAVRMDDQRVQLTVRDDGIGIPTANLGRVFDPFFTTKLGRGGSGLGLNIVYNLVARSLGGKLEVSSTLGQGTCFTFVLPLQAPVVEIAAQEGVAP